MSHYFCLKYCSSSVAHTFMVEEGSMWVEKRSQCFQKCKQLHCSHLELVPGCGVVGVGGLEAGRKRGQGPSKTDMSLCTDYLLDQWFSNLAAH